MQQPPAARADELLESFVVERLGRHLDLTIDRFGLHKIVDRRQPPELRIELRPASQQALGVGVLGVAEDVDDAAVFDDLSVEHHRHVVGDFGDHAQVVRDEQHRHAPLVAQMAEDVENLSLNRHVERGRRLVGDQQLGIARERHGDHHPLLLPAGHLVRVIVDAIGRFGDADLVEQFDGTFSGFGPAGLLMEHDRLHHLRPDGEHRVERSHRLLEDHADLFAANFAHLRLRQPHQIPPQKRNLPLLNLRRTSQQPHHRQRSHRFTRARLADNPKRHALFDFERDVVDGLNRSFFRVEVGLKAFDGDECGRLGHGD